MRLAQRAGKAKMDKTVRLTVKTTRTLLLPKVPNFLRTEADDPVGVETLTEDQLREVGTAWTSALIENARNRRGDMTAKFNRAMERERAREKA